MEEGGLDEEVEGARQAAARRVSEWLTVPEDLQTKLPKLRANVQASQLATDAQLRALVQSQLDSSRTGLELLSLSRARVSNIQAKCATHHRPVVVRRPPTHPPTHSCCWLVGWGGDSLRAVDTLCVETQGLIGHYELIKAGLVFLSSSPPPPLALTAGGPVNDARSNLHYTRRQLDRTLEIPDKVLLHRSFAPPPPTLKGADALLLTRSRRSGRCWRTKSTSCRPITRSRTWRSSEKGPYAMLGDSPLQSCWKESSPLISSHCIHTFRAARGNTEQYEVIEKIFTDVSKLYERA